MKKYQISSMTIAIILLVVSCSDRKSNQVDILDNSYAKEQSELKEVVKSIISDAETTNLEGLKAIHLVSDKFTKFGPRSFERQDIEETNESELAFFGSISNYK